MTARQIIEARLGRALPPASRWHHTAAIVAGALAGLFIAWGMGL